MEQEINPGFSFPNGKHSMTSNGSLKRNKSKKRSPYSKIFLLQNLDFLLKQQEQEGVEQSPTRTLNKMFEFFDGSRFPFVIEASESTPGLIGDNFMTLFDEIEVQALDKGLLAAFFMTILHLETLVGNFGLDRLGCRAKVPRDATAADLLNERLNDLMVSVIEVKENIREFGKIWAGFAEVVKLIEYAEFDFNLVISRLRMYFFGAGAEGRVLLKNDLLSRLSVIKKDHGDLQGNREGKGVVGRPGSVRRGGISEFRVESSNRILEKKVSLSSSSESDYMQEDDNEDLKIKIGIEDFESHPKKSKNSQKKFRLLKLQKSQSQSNKKITRRHSSKKRNKRQPEGYLVDQIDPLISIKFPEARTELHQKDLRGKLIEASCHRDLLACSNPLLRRELVETYQKIRSKNLTVFGQADFIDLQETRSKIAENLQTEQMVENLKVFESIRLDCPERLNFFSLLSKTPLSLLKKERKCKTRGSKIRFTRNQ